MKKFWAIFFMVWPVLAVATCAIAPSMNWWFPGAPMSRIGERIDWLFYVILAIVAVTFVGTQVALGYVLWKGATKAEDSSVAYNDGNHKLEVVWTIVPGIVLVFISVIQMDVWADFRITERYDEKARSEGPWMEVNARQFEWRMRYPAPGQRLMNEEMPTDVHAVNEMHLPSGRPVIFNLRTMDVQHSFFAPELRIKQDAVPGKIIPMMVDIPTPGSYSLVCAELCGWGHYKMAATIVAEPEEEAKKYIRQRQLEQNFDGVELGSSDD